MRSLTISNSMFLAVSAGWTSTHWGSCITWMVLLASTLRLSMDSSSLFSVLTDWFSSSKGSLNYSKMLSSFTKISLSSTISELSVPSRSIY